MKQEDRKILEEAQEMVDYLEDYTEAMLPKEREFLEDMADQIPRDCWISQKQLNWLRSLYDKY